MGQNSNTDKTLLIRTNGDENNDVKALPLEGNGDSFKAPYATAALPTTTTLPTSDPLLPPIFELKRTILVNGESKKPVKCSQDNFSNFASMEKQCKSKIQQPCMEKVNQMPSQYTKLMMHKNGGRRDSRLYMPPTSSPHTSSISNATAEISTTSAHHYDSPTSPTLPTTLETIISTTTSSACYSFPVISTVILPSSLSASSTPLTSTSLLNKNSFPASPFIEGSFSLNYYDSSPASPPIESKFPQSSEGNKSPTSPTIDGAFPQICDIPSPASPPPSKQSAAGNTTPQSYYDDTSPASPTTESAFPQISNDSSTASPPPSEKSMATSTTTQCYDDSISPASPTTESEFPQICDDLSPASPPPSEKSVANSTTPIPIPLDCVTKRSAYANKSLLHKMISNYNIKTYVLLKKMNSHKDTTLQKELRSRIEEFLQDTLDTDEMVLSAAQHLATDLYERTKQDPTVLSGAIVFVMRAVPRPEIELSCDVSEVPQKYLSKSHRRISYVMRHLQMLHPKFAHEQLGQIEQTIFSYNTTEKLALSVLLNLTQLYLLTISVLALPPYTVGTNPARLFVAKCLYYYNLMATPMIYEVLCYFPTTLPHREERFYDHSDALITVIKHLLMSNKYDMDKVELRTKELLSILRFEYHFEPFKPERQEVFTNLLMKIKAAKVDNVSYAMALLCKRMPQPKVETDILQSQLLPLAMDYYRSVTTTTHSENNDDKEDVSIACLLECISMVIKPFRIDTDISSYLSLFSLFLNAAETRPRIQEAAVQAIIRCQRFGFVSCYHRLCHFAPTFELQLQTKAMLKTFVYRKHIKFLRNLQKWSDLSAP